MKFAIMGLRHAHINDLITRVRTHNDLELVALCEEDETARDKVLSEHTDVPVFDSYEKLLNEVDCDAIGVGDYYGKRGQIALTALQHGKHVISDKPLCTSLDELNQIENLAQTKNLSIGCQLDMRDTPTFRTLRALTQSGELGRLHAISFGGQHPLIWGTRPGWYFEEGKHGGTINDIAIHAVDFLPLLTGSRIATINAARNWNARVPQAPHFKDAAQLMLTMEDGCGVLGDVSYFLPDSFGYTHPMYWRLTLWGEGGVAETSSTVQEITFYKNGETQPRQIAVENGTPGGYLEAFVSEVRGTPQELDTKTVLQSARAALTAQHAADANQTNVEL